MKKRGWKIAVIVFLLLVAIGATGFFAVRNSPEYALLTMAKDVRDAGVEGLKPHLTGQALELVEKLGGKSDNRFWEVISTILDTDQLVEMMKTELAKVEWKLDDFDKSAHTAEISLRFNYSGKLSGEVELDMLRDENGAWKISEIKLSDLDRP